jgi:hypothetical protein
VTFWFTGMAFPCSQVTQIAVLQKYIRFTDIDLRRMITQPSPQARPRYL